MARFSTFRWPIGRSQQPSRRWSCPKGITWFRGSRGEFCLCVKKLKDQTRNRSGRSPSDAVPNAVFAEVQTMVEKGSDVNLAAHLLNDAWNGVFEVAAVISNDTYLVTPIDMVKRQGKKFCRLPADAQSCAEAAQCGERRALHSRKAPLRRTVC